MSYKEFPDMAKIKIFQHFIPGALIKLFESSDYHRPQEWMYSGHYLQQPSLRLTGLSWLPLYRDKESHEARRRGADTPHCPAIPGTCRSQRWTPCVAMLRAARFPSSLMHIDITSSLSVRLRGGAGRLVQHVTSRVGTATVQMCFIHCPVQRLQPRTLGRNRHV